MQFLVISIQPADHEPWKQRILQDSDIKNYKNNPNDLPTFRWAWEARKAQIAVAAEDYGNKIEVSEQWSAHDTSYSSWIRSSRPLGQTKGNLCWQLALEQANSRPWEMFGFDLNVTSPQKKGNSALSILIEIQLYLLGVFLHVSN